MEAMHRPFDSEEIITLARLEELLPEWKGLWSSAQHCTPFQFAEWIVWWWRWFGAGRLTALALRDGKRLVAIVAGAVRDGTGAAEFDFLRGQERYKYFWGAEDRPTYRCLLQRGALNSAPAA
jgi:CelD/BcsL family acetyltransferase involved in cellulose biosynthesis